MHVKRKKILFRRFLLDRTVINEKKYKVYKSKLTAIFRLAEENYYDKLL